MAASQPACWDCSLRWKASSGPKHGAAEVGAADSRHPTRCTYCDGALTEALGTKACVQQGD